MKCCYQGWYLLYLVNVLAFGSASKMIRLKKCIKWAFLRVSLLFLLLTPMIIWSSIWFEWTLFCKLFIHASQFSSSVRPKNQGPISVSVSELIFFSATKTLIFLIFFFYFVPLLLGIQVFITLKKTQFLKYLMFEKNFGFRGPFMIRENTSCYRWLDSPFKM